MRIRRCLHFQKTCFYQQPKFGCTSVDSNKKTAIDQRFFNQKIFAQLKMHAFSNRQRIEFEMPSHAKSHGKRNVFIRSSETLPASRRSMCCGIRSLARTTVPRRSQCERARKIITAIFQKRSPFFLNTHTMCVAIKKVKSEIN